jgi:hypothetical protein
MNTKTHKSADQQKEKARRRVEGRKPSTHDQSVQPAPAEAHRRATMGPPSVATPQDFLALQSSVGNRAVQRLAAARRPGAASTSTPVQRHINPGQAATIRTRSGYARELAISELFQDAIIHLSLAVGEIISGSEESATRPSPE